MKLRLNGVENLYEVNENTTMSSLNATFSTIGEVDAFREVLTDKALKKIEFLDNAGGVMGSYDNYKFGGSVAYTKTADGYIASYPITKKTDVEVRLDNLEEEQELQNGAIDELASEVGGV